MPEETPVKEKDQKSSKPIEPDVMTSDELGERLKEEKEKERALAKEREVTETLLRGILNACCYWTEQAQSVEELQDLKQTQVPETRFYQFL